MRLRYGILLVIMLMMSNTLLLAQSEDTEWVCPPGHQGEILHVYNWTTYIAPETIGIFEEKCSVEVVYSEFSDDEQMLVELRRGNTDYGVVVPGLETVGLMVEERLLLPLDHDLIPNLSNLFTNFRELPQDPDQNYSVPYQWGTIGIGYNQEKVTTPITGWAEVFDYDGKIGWMNEPQILLGIGLRYLGYEGSTRNVDDLAQARDLLIDFGLDNAYIIDDDEGQELLRSGELDIVIEYSGDILQLNEDCNCNDYVYVIPQEGTNLWLDMMAIPIDAPNVELSHIFIDFILDVHISAGISNATSYASPNRAALEQGLIRSDLLANPAIYPPVNELDKMFMLPTPRGDIRQIYLNYWDEISILLGRDEDE